MYSSAAENTLGDTYFENDNKTFTLHHGDCLEVMAELPEDNRIEYEYWTDTPPVAGGTVDRGAHYIKQIRYTVRSAPSRVAVAAGKAAWTRSTS